MRATTMVAMCAVCTTLGIGTTMARPLGAQQLPASSSVPHVAGPLADSVRGFAYEMVALLQARNTDAVIALYGDTARFIHVEDGVVIPWPQLARSIRTFFATATANPVRVTGEPRVTIIDGQAAVIVVSHATDAQTSRPAHEGVWTGVLRREAGRWKIVHSHSSDRRAGDSAR